MAQSQLWIGFPGRNLILLRTHALRPDAGDVSGPPPWQTTARGGRTLWAACRHSSLLTARIHAASMAVAWVTSVAGGAGVLASRLVSSLAPPDRWRLGERLRAGSGISGNGEPEQGFLTPVTRPAATHSREQERLRRWRARFPKRPGSCHLSAKYRKKTARTPRLRRGESPHHQSTAGNGGLQQGS